MKILSKIKEITNNLKHCNVCDFLDFTKDFHDYSKFIYKLSDIRFFREVQFFCVY